MKYLSNSQLAALCKVEPSSIHAALSRHSNFLGLRPVKLPNGRLLWPEDAVAKMLVGGARP